MTLRKHAALDAMLNADTNDFDLPALLQEGRLILIDTNKEKFTSDQAHVFGRLFIALIHNVMRKRVGKDEQHNKPAFIYIDELPDYCPRTVDDPKLRELLDQGRKQRLGFILAHQREDQINPAVLTALQDSAIRTRCLTQGLAEFTIKERPLTVPVSEFKFRARITDEEYARRYAKRELTSVVSRAHEDAPEATTDFRP